MYRDDDVTRRYLCEYKRIIVRFFIAINCNSLPNVFHSLDPILGYVYFSSYLGSLDLQIQALLHKYAIMWIR